MAAFLSPEALRAREEADVNPQTDESPVTPTPVPLALADPSWRSRAGFARAARFSGERDRSKSPDPVRPSLRRLSTARPRVMTEDELSVASSSSRKEFGELPQARREKLGFSGTESRFESPLGFQRQWVSQAPDFSFVPKSSFDSSEVRAGGCTSVFRSTSDRCQWIRDLKGCGADFVPKAVPSAFARSTSPTPKLRSSRSLSPARPLAFGSFLAHDSILGCRADVMVNPSTDQKGPPVQGTASRFSLLGSYLEFGNSRSPRRGRGRSPTRRGRSRSPVPSESPEEEKSVSAEYLDSPAATPRPDTTEDEHASVGVVIVRKKTPVVLPPPPPAEEGEKGEEKEEEKEEEGEEKLEEKEKPKRKKTKKPTLPETPEQRQQRVLRRHIMASKAVRDEAATTMAAWEADPPPPPQKPQEPEEPEEPARGRSLHRAKRENSPRRRRMQPRPGSPGAPDPVPLAKPAVRVAAHEESPSMDADAMDDFLGFVRLLVESSCPAGEEVHIDFDRKELTRALMVGSVDAKNHPPAIDIVPRQPRKAAAAALAQHSMPVLVLRKGKHTVATLSTGAPGCTPPGSPAAPAAGPAAGADGLGWAEVSTELRIQQQMEQGEIPAELLSENVTPRSLARAATLLQRFSPDMRQRLVDLIFERSQRLRSGEHCYLDNLVQLVYRADAAGV